MANRTDPLATSVHGTNPQFLVSKIIRSKIHASRFWKEVCFGLTAETIIDKAVKLQCVGGTYGGNKKATNFLCLILKLLQIQPDKEILVEYIKQDDYKYLRAIGAFYLRLTGSAVDIYSYLEPLLIDYRKLRFLNPDGKTRIIRLDEFIDDILRKEHFLEIDLPGLAGRHVLEDMKLLSGKISVLDGDLEFATEELLDEAVDDVAKTDRNGDGGTHNNSKKYNDKGHERRISRSVTPHRKHNKRRSVSYSRSPSRRRSVRRSSPPKDNDSPSAMPRGSTGTQLKERLRDGTRRRDRECNGTRHRSPQPLKDTCRRRTSIEKSHRHARSTSPSRDARPSGRYVRRHRRFRSRSPHSRRHRPRSVQRNYVTRSRSPRTRGHGRRRSHSKSTSPLPRRHRHRRPSYD